MPLVASWTFGENRLKLAVNVPAAPVVTVSTPLGPELEDPPLLPPQAASRPAIATAATVTAIDRSFQCLVIVDTHFRQSAVRAGARGIRRPEATTRCAVIETLYRLSVKALIGKNAPELSSGKGFD